MILNEQEFIDAQIALTPQGAIWPRDHTHPYYPIFKAWAKELRRIAILGGKLRSESIPSETLNFLPDWFRVTNLPGPCVSLDELITVTAQRALLVTHLTNRSSSHPDFYISLAAMFGYEITIDEFDDPHVWTVSIPGGVIRPRFSGENFGEFYSSNLASLLTCILLELKPAHTRLEFV